MPHVPCRRALRANVLVAVAAFTLTACGGTTEVARDVPGVLTRITVTPANASVAAGQTQQFTAVGTDASNGVLAITPQWAVTGNAGVITGAGLFSATTVPGVYTDAVKATSGGISGATTVTVVPGPAATITVAPDTVTLGVGATHQFAATAVDAYGNATTITPVWSVVGGGGTITAAGLFTASTMGAFPSTVQAAVNGVKGFASVTVVAGEVTAISMVSPTVTLGVGEQKTFTVSGTDAAGNPVPVTATWSVVAGGGTIDPVTGVFTAGSTSGTFANTVKATVGTLTAFATVTVNPGGVASVTIAGPAAVRLGVNGQLQFTVSGTDAHGNPVVFTPVWAVSEGGGSIDGSGLYIAGHKAGQFLITAGAPGSTTRDTVAVTVDPGPMKLIAITPAQVTLWPVGTQQFTSVGMDEYQNTIPVVTAWSLDNGGGTIGVLGLFTAGWEPGNFVVRATANNMTTTAAVTVRPVWDLGRASGFALLLAGSVQYYTYETHVTGDVGFMRSGALGARAALNGAPPPWPTGNMYGPNDPQTIGAAADAAAVKAALRAVRCRPAPPNNVAAAVIAPVAIIPGKYCPDVINFDVTFELDAQGNPDALFIFQASSVTLAGPTGPTFAPSVNPHITLVNGARVQNVFWLVDDLRISNFDALGTFFVENSVVLENGVMAGHVFANSAVRFGPFDLSIPNQIFTNRRPGGASVLPNRSPAVRPSPTKP